MTAPTTIPPEFVPTDGLWHWRRDVWRSDRTSMAPRGALVAALTAGTIATLTLQVTVVSIAYLLTGAAVAATAFVTVRPRPTPLQLVVVVGALALLAVAALRGADWLVALCVVASWVVGSVALVGGWTWTGLALASVALWLTPVRVTGWVRRGRARLRPGRRVEPVRVFVVAAISVALLAVFGSLFVSADPEFGRLFDAALPDVRVGNPAGRVLLGLFVAGMALASAYLRRRTPRFDALAPGPGHPLARWEWAVPLALLDALFAGFVAVQVRVLFGGDRHVRDTVGLTYANYARQGFWQLAAVTVLTLALVAVAVRKVDRRSAGDRALARVLLGLLCGLGLVVVASAVHRMSLYENEFGFTRLRLSVMATELWLGVVFVLLLLAGIRMSARWLPRAVLASAAIGLLGFAALNPDGYIAERNVQRYAATGDIDVAYLGGLSVDAVPALDRLAEPVRSCALSGIDVGGGTAWFEYNAARSRAREILRGRPVTACTHGSW
ncbi:DUF4153 domain-containing protein [Rhodococcus sp. AG1013]|uniref:DUF4153 domain-containing protein n=1 Tax=unclassified Rhodococcus (in: high G+C Gram-positive bacteria) TaxID=192944 RepID=UPI000E0B9788|nr:DUF4173 domain-containing protein [Rhodococcus sp. AG1013]RDI22590.1 uncharacterized protein DUF4173 [Rhodococcus sp. AG1013]